MSEIKLIGNGHLIPLQYAWELTPARLREAKREHDWAFADLEDDADCEHQFFWYRGWLYILDDFMRVERRTAPEWMQEFDAYTNDSFFSGVVIKYVDQDFDGDCVKAWTFIS
jgi:hypothetical protein